MTQNDVMITIVNAVREFAEAAGTPVNGDLTADTHLFGGDGLLDSLGLVSVLMDVEQTINDELGTEITIADERAMSQERSPFRQVGSLTDYVMTLLDEAGVNGRTPDNGAL